ncbi:GTP cyclohydrolase I FolE [uncultured Eubacterium sp.]|uniref:GTP cyclohydrolase I FolE n=1 Tax=uncultured Eubacterium sp. TaxID=165185 RepID=UPI00267216F7|nr:GTP cyclohydrolase I FolE [uncultured Eubacterium sp.]
MFDQKKIQEAVKLLLEGIGEDVNREGLKETPARVARMYQELCAGMEQSPKEHLSKVFSCDNENVVIEKDITFYSTCEHHLMPFYGKVHIAYIPNGRVVGISKLARTVEVYARRLQIQEQMTNQIAEAIEEYLGAKGVYVMVEAEHMCMSARGIKKPGSKTITFAAKGVFQENQALRQEITMLVI